MIPYGSKVTGHKWLITESIKVACSAQYNWAEINQNDTKIVWVEKFSNLQTKNYFLNIKKKLFKIADKNEIKVEHKFRNTHLK